MPTDGAWDHLVMVEVPTDHELKTEIIDKIKEDSTCGMYNVMHLTMDCRIASETPVPIGVVA